ncbi:MAG: GntR family transcriptional regulator [Rhodospirillaceae bacterium]
MLDESPIADATQAAPKAPRETAVQRIYGELREKIIDLQLPAGMVLSKNDIAADFGVSQTPVREALILLEEEGLVDVYPQSRTVVSYIDVQSAREAHFLRRSVEVEVARTLAGAIEDDQVTELRNLIADQKTAGERGEHSRFLALDNFFHQRMYEMAGIGGLWDVVRSNRAHLDRLRRLHLPVGNKAKDIVSDHTAIIDAIAGRDPEKAEAAVRDHLKGTVFKAKEIRKHFPEYFA